MRITLDATPLLGPRTGVGRYVEQLLAHLPAATATAFGEATVEASTWSWRGGAVTELPPGVVQVGRRVPARVLRALWQHGNLPSAEALVGRIDIFHGTNFVSPPTRTAAEVVTIHDLTYLHLPGTVDPQSLAYRELVPRALRRGALVVTPSRVVATAVRAEYGLADERVAATPLGVEDAWSRARPLSPGRLAELGLDRYLVFVGSSGPRKNLGRLLTAHTAARHADPSTPDLVLAGPAGHGDSPLPAGVVRVGWLCDDDLQGLVAGSLGLVLPSLDEGFGLPVLEALAAGRPVLAADLPSLHEVGGTQARYADPYDVDALSDGLVRLLDAPDDETARAARRTHAASFSWAACARATVEVYRRAVR